MEMLSQKIGRMNSASLAQNTEMYAEKNNQEL
jgi:hypothetical protein